VFNAFELLYVAKQEARAGRGRLSSAAAGTPHPVAGDVGIATFKMMLVNMLEGRFISEHDYEIATRIATVLCGGEVDRGSLVDEEWLLTWSASTSSNCPAGKDPRIATC
jgi:3-hydroxyacyl-CoA dehydrogenase